MANALPKSNNDPEYLSHFGLESAPFARLVDPTDLFLTEQYSFLLAHLSSAAEDPDSVVVICGRSGSGKTSLLNRFISTLDPNLCFASISERCKTETDFFVSVLRQFGFGDITGTLDELRRITREFLIQQGIAGDPVLLLIDNAHMLNPRVFEQLRWTVGVRQDSSAVVNLVLAGHPDLALIMESPAMSQISMKNHVRFNIRAYSEDEVMDYIWHRLNLAGGEHTVQLAEEVYPLIYRYTGGNPRLINVLCDDALRQAYLAESLTITGDMLRQAAEHNQLVPHAVPLQSKNRRKSDPGYQPPAVTPGPAEEVTPKKSRSSPTAAGEPVGDTETSAEDFIRTDVLDKPPPDVVEPRDTVAHDESTARQDIAGDTPARAEPPTLTVDKRAAERARLRQEKMQTELEARSALIDTLETKLEEKNRALEHLVNDLEGSDKESRALKARLDKLTERLARQDKTTARLAADLSARRSTISKLEADLREASERLVTLDGLEEGFRRTREQLADRESEVTTLRADLSILKRRESDLTHELELANGRLSEISTLKQALSALEEEAGARAEELADLKRGMAEREQAVSRLEVSLKDTESRHRKLESESQLKTDQLESVLSDRDDRIRALEQQSGEHETEIDALRGERHAQSVRISSLETELSRAAKQAARLEDQLRENEKLSALLTDKEQELRSLHENLQDHAEAGNLYQAEIARIGKLEIELEEARKTSADIKAALGAREEDVEALQNELREEKDEKRWLKDEVKRLRQVDEQLEDEKARASALAGEAGEHARHIEKLSEELDARQAALEEAEARARSLEATQAELDGARTQIESLQSELEIARKEIENLSSRDQQQARELEGMQAANERLTHYESRLAEEEAKALALQEALNESQRSVEEMTAKLADQMTLQDAANEKIGELVRLESEVITAGHAIEELEKTIEEKSRTTTALESELEARDRRVSSLESQLDDLRAVSEDLRAQLKAAGEKDSELERQRARIEALTEDAADQSALRDELAVLAEQLDAARGKLAASDELNQSLESQLRQTETALTDAKQLLASHSEELDSARTQLIRTADLEAEIARLNRQGTDGDAIRDDAEDTGIQPIGGEQFDLSKSAVRLSMVRDGQLESEFLQPLLGLRCMIGRSKDNELTLASDTVSRHHALLSFSDGYLSVEDLNSTNGIEINARRVTSGRLRPGDILTVGEYEIKLSIEASGQDSES